MECASKKAKYSDNPYPCSRLGCLYTFKSESARNQHLKKHDPERRYVCDQQGIFGTNKCDLRFGDIQSLKCHIRTHTGELPFPCSLCSSKFGDHSNFNRHMKTQHNSTTMLFRCSCSCIEDDEEEVRQCLFTDTHPTFANLFHIGRKTRRLLQRRFERRFCDYFDFDMLIHSGETIAS